MNPKNLYFFLTVIAGLLIVVLGAYVAVNVNFSGYKHFFEKDGVEFVSNEAQPSEIIAGFREEDVILVSPSFFVEKGPENTYMASSVTLLNTVLVAKGKKVIVVARVVGKNGELIACQSNKGDPRLNEEITLEECNQRINDPIYPRVFVSLPDPKLQKPRIVLGNGWARIYPSSYENVSSSTFTFLNAIYPDAQRIVEGINSVVERF